MQRRVFDRFGMRTHQHDMASRLRRQSRRRLGCRRQAGAARRAQPRRGPPGRWTPRWPISRDSPLATCAARACRPRPRRADARPAADHDRVAVPVVPAGTAGGSRRRRTSPPGSASIVFDGPQGPGFYKGGHNDSTGNTWVCLERRRDCVVILANDVRAEPAFPRLVALLLGDTGAPWRWEYGDMTFTPLRPAPAAP